MKEQQHSTLAPPACSVRVIPETSD